MALALVLSLLIGVSLGMLGGGGSILTLPILVYVLHLDAKPAVATSLLNADLIDEVILLRGGKPIGEDGVPPLRGLPLTALTQAPRFKSLGSEKLGNDTLEHWVRG